MIDIRALKEQLDLLALVERDTALRRVASSGGGEWAGPCPFCGGSDRFRVQPKTPGGGRWLCRGCTGGKWQDAIEYGRRLWPGLDFGEVCRRLAEGTSPQNTAHSHRKAHPASSDPSYTQSHSNPYPLSPAYTAPEPGWQSLAERAIVACERALWGKEGERALDYLRRRALQDETIRYWRLGYSVGVRIDEGTGDKGHEVGEAGRSHPYPPSLHGEGAGGAGIVDAHSPSSSEATSLYIPKGVVIPCLELDQTWYLKIALLPGQPVKCGRCGEMAPARQPCPKCGALNKYRGVKGNRTGAIFGAGELRGADLALFVEGEMDALTAWQELRDVTAVCTLGSAANHPDLAVWGASLAPLERILAVYDADQAGQAGLKALQEMSERVEPVHLPAGVKDINDYLLQGGDLWAWLKGVLGG